MNRPKLVAFLLAASTLAGACAGKSNTPSSASTPAPAPVVALSSVDQFAVGEVFIVAGQSNAGNYGSEKQVNKTKLVSEFDGKQWNLANDPQLGAGGNGGSFMPAFGEDDRQGLSEQLLEGCCSRHKAMTVGTGGP